MSSTDKTVLSSDKFIQREIPRSMDSFAYSLPAIDGKAKT
jgi:hypothetical protein